MKPRVLIVSPQVHPTPHSGTGMRAHFQARHLSSFLEVTVATTSGNYDVRNGIFHRIGGRTPSEPGRYAAYANSILHRTPYSYEKFACRRWALPEVAGFDCIILHYPALLGLLDRIDLDRGPLLMLDTHNNERAYYESVANLLQWPVNWAVLQQACRSETLIGRWRRRIDVTISVSEQDRLWIRQLVGDHAHHMLMPNNLFEFQPTRWRGTRNILYVGSLNVKINLQALDWFRRMVWPRVRGMASDLAFVVAGRDPSPSLIKELHADDVTVLANPDALVRAFEEAALAIVPGRSGSGAKIKVCEALAFGVPVLTTTAGVVGQPHDVRECCIVRDTPSEWVSAILEQLANSDRSSRAWLSQVRAALARTYFGDAAADLAALLELSCAARRNPAAPTT